MSNPTDRISHLRSLKLTEHIRHDEPTDGSRWQMLGYGVAIGAVTAGVLVWVIKPDQNADGFNSSTSFDVEAAAADESGATRLIAGGDLVASGYVVARRRATVAAEITGRVIEVTVEEGMRVTKGQVLARLDNSAAMADRKSAQARLSAAQANITALEADLADAIRIDTRTRELAANGYASNANLTSAQAKAAALRAQVDSAVASRNAAASELASIDVQLAKHEIRAPFSGVVVDKSAQPGEIISPVSAGGGFTRTGICTLVDMDSLEIEVDVNEAYIGRVREGMLVNAVIDAYPDLVLPGRVIATVPTANREKATVRVRIGFLKRDPRVLPDMAIKVTFRDEGA